eukprot:644519-Rhodomonas_salina.2
MSGHTDRHTATDTKHTHKRIQLTAGSRVPGEEVDGGDGPVRAVPQRLLGSVQLKRRNEPKRCKARHEEVQGA